MTASNIVTEEVSYETREQQRIEAFNYQIEHNIQDEQLISLQKLFNDLAKCYETKSDDKEKYKGALNNISNYLSNYISINGVYICCFEVNMKNTDKGNTNYIKLWILRGHICKTVIYENCSIHYDMNNKTNHFVLSD